MKWRRRGHRWSAGAGAPRCDAAGTRGAGALAREREERVREALSYLPRAQAKKERQLHTKATDQRPKVTKARVSTTDPQATVMKMPDGGFRPACNVELATDCANGIIVGVAVARRVRMQGKRRLWRSNWSGGRAGTLSPT